MNKSRASKNYENLQKCIFEGVPPFSIPQLFPTQYLDKCEFIPFNYAKSCKERKNKGIHFFIDDYQFNRLWTNVDRYIDMLSQFQYVMTPDFSIYTDFQKAIQIYNHYRKHWVGAYLQEAGAKVVPTISWSAPDSFEWCFDENLHIHVWLYNPSGRLTAKTKKNYFLPDIMRC